MKKLIIAAALMIPLISFGQGSSGPGAITTTLRDVNSPHHFAGQSWNLYNSTTTMGGQICQPCHTPHNAQTAGFKVPLWNHQLSAATGYSMYTKFSGTAALEGLTAPTGFSLLCLSCHDGSVALGSFGGQSGGSVYIGAGYTTQYGGRAASASTLLSKDLTNDHPVSVSKAAATTKMISTYTSPGVYTNGTKALSTWLEDYNGTFGEVQCTSCHSPHSNRYGYQLKQSNQGSAICLNCHF